MSALDTVPNAASKGLFGWLERMLDRLGPFGRRGALGVADRLVVAGTNFLTLVMVGRAAGVEGLGVFALAWTVLLATNAVQEAFVTSPYTVFATRPPSAVARARYTACAFLFFAALTGFGAVVCVAVWLGNALGFGVTMGLGDRLGLDDATSRTALLALAAALPASALRELARRLLFARMAALRALVLDVATAVLQLMTLAFLWAFGALTPATALLAIALGTGLPALVWAAHARRLLRAPPLAFLRREARRHLLFARWLGAAQLSDLAVTHGIVWWVAGLAGAAAAGTFTAGNTLVLVVNPLILGIGAVLLPHTALAQHRQGPQAVAKVVWKVTAFLSIAAGLIGLAVALAGGLLVEHLYGLEPTSDLRLTVALLALATVLGASAFAADNGLIVIGRQDVNLAASLVGLVITFGGAALLLPTMGIVGAALAVVLGTGVNAILQLIAFARLTRR